MGDKMGDNLQISKLKIKNLQKWAQFLMLEIKRFTIHICRHYAFFAKNLLAHAETVKIFHPDLNIFKTRDRLLTEIMLTFATNKLSSTTALQAIGQDCNDNNSSLKIQK